MIKFAVVLFAPLTQRGQRRHKHRRYVSITAYGILLTVLTGFAAPLALAAKPITVAVASNFLPTMKHIVALYEQEGRGKVTLSAGSTGRHYAQLTRGAPYDLFFAADEARPKALEAKGIAGEGSRFSYAIGRLVLWGKALPSSPGSTFHGVLQRIQPKTLSIANPTLAPYGRAALEVLTHRNTPDTWRQATRVRGENVSQALQFVQSGNVEAGLVALSQLTHLVANGLEGNHYRPFIVVPSHLHAPIVQQAVVIRASEDTDRFLAFFHSDKIQRVIRLSGYELPTS